MYLFSLSVRSTYRHFGVRVAHVGRKCSLAVHQRIGDCQHADPPEIHHKHQHHLGTCRQSAGDTGGNAHRADSGGGFIEHVHNIFGRHGVDNQHAGEQADQLYADDRSGSDKAVLGDVPPENDGLLFSDRDAENRHDENAESADLDTARRGAGGAADKHQQNAEDLRVLGKVAVVHGGKTGGTPGGGLEERNQQLAERGRNRAKGGGVFPFKDGEEHGSHQQKATGDNQDDTGVDRQVPTALGKVHKVAPHEKSDAADDDKERQRQVDQRVGHVIGKGSNFRISHADDIKSGVAESGNRVKDALENAVAPTEIRHETESEDHGADALNGEGSGCNAADQHDDAVITVHVVGHCQKHSFLGGDRAAHEQGHQDCHGHEAQPPHLDQKKNDHVTEGAPVCGGVLHDKTGHAGGADRGEAGVQKGRRRSVRRRYGEHQEKGPDKNNGEKAKRYDLGGTEMFAYRMGFQWNSSLLHGKAEPQWDSALFNRNHYSRYFEVCQGKRHKCRRTCAVFYFAGLSPVQSRSWASRWRLDQIQPQ